MEGEELQFMVTAWGRLLWAPQPSSSFFFPRDPARQGWKRPVWAALPRQYPEASGWIQGLLPGSSPFSHHCGPTCEWQREWDLGVSQPGTGIHSHSPTCLGLVLGGSFLPKQSFGSLTAQELMNSVACLPRLDSGQQKLESPSDITDWQHLMGGSGNGRNTMRHSPDSKVFGHQQCSKAGVPSLWAAEQYRAVAC